MTSRPKSMKYPDWLPRLETDIYDVREAISLLMFFIAILIGTPLTAMFYVWLFNL